MRINKATATYLIWFVLVSASSAYAEDSRAVAVQADVKRCLEAVYSADVETSLRCTHPKVIETMGGRPKAAETLSKTYSTFKQAGMKLDSLDFPKAPTFFSDSDNDYCFVPTLSVIERGGKKAESLNFQMGVRSKGGGKWTYFEGSRLNKENVRSLFPSFPADVIFPGIYRKPM